MFLLIIPVTSADEVRPFIVPETHCYGRPERFSETRGSGLVRRDVDGAPRDWPLFIGRCCEINTCSAGVTIPLILQAVYIYARHLVPSDIRADIDARVIELIEQMGKRIRGLCVNFWNGIANLCVNFWNGIANLCANFWSGIVAAWRRVLTVGRGHYNTFMGRNEAVVPPAVPARNQGNRKTYYCS